MPHDAFDKAKIQHLLDQYPFQPAYGLSNAHSQTLAPRFLKKQTIMPLTLTRLATPDDDFLRLHTLMGEKDAPMVVIAHGLEGGVHSNYVQSLLRHITTFNWSATVFEHRSCGGEMNRQRRLYHSGETSDIAFVIEHLAKVYPDKPLFAVGYSLGGNQLAKWLGLVGDAAPKTLCAAAVVSAPFDLAASAAFMDSGVRLAYVRYFLKKLMPKAQAKNQQYPGCIDVAALKGATTFRQFDNHVTAALHGFRDADDYYQQSGSGQYLHGIRRPTLLISAFDDPFNPGDTLPIAQVTASDYLLSQFVPHGGHVGFVDQEFQRHSQGITWADQQIMRFLQANLQS